MAVDRVLKACSVVYAGTVVLLVDAYRDLIQVTDFFTTF
jgi:hypothetical protein